MELTRILVLKATAMAGMGNREASRSYLAAVKAHEDASIWSIYFKAQQFAAYLLCPRILNSNKHPV